jgi:hypothetical protein
MTLQEVKTEIESNTGLVGAFITSSNHSMGGEYVRTTLDYQITLNPQDSVIHKFIAHSISGSYSMDKNYDNTINYLKSLDMEWDSRDYLNSLTGSTISTWDDFSIGGDNPNVGYAKVYITSASIEGPHAWLLTRTGSAITHSSTTWDQFPIDED